ncbi:hypothetical protein PR202_gb29034 [Eleusine coracana subsp. coracana]|uniref:USP domain-containing protein n=1 Tax=Eleusine coracana subsp. coracana TaxID=191504 RepID=A0AAV5FW02_ELECO|nr:hypothetical protein PR202_gb29034 [Eleusine coracana subsp. coracana]
MAAAAFSSPPPFFYLVRPPPTAPSGSATLATYKEIAPHASSGQVWISRLGMGKPWSPRPKLCLPGLSAGRKQPAMKPIGPSRPNCYVGSGSFNRLSPDAMGDKEGKKRARSVEPDESSRKAARLESQDSAREGASNPDKTPSPELTDSGCLSSDTSSEACRHFLVDEEEMDLILAKIESLKCGFGPACECCKLESAAAGQVDPNKQQLIMVCTQCDQCLCAGVAKKDDQPLGHARPHAQKNEHWVALWLDEPKIGYCFFCDVNVYVHASSGGSDSGSSVDDGSLSPEAEVEPAAADDHALASGSNTDDSGYVIRGIPNIGNTCYMNVVVQCLLVLDKLRTRMLGTDAPKGSIGTALRELFLKTRASNDARGSLNPRNLLKSIRELDPKYNGNSMHDSHELLCSLRTGLNEEEMKRSGAVTSTVVDSIFQGQLSKTRTNICCQYETVLHDPFHELSLPLASKKHLSKSIASPERTHRSQQKGPAVKQQFLTVEEHNSENQIITDGVDSGILLTEVESVAMEESPEPLEVDYSEAIKQIHQRKNILHGPLLTHKDVVSFPETIEVPVKSVTSLPDSVFSAKVDSAYQSNKPEADIESKENTCTVQLIRVPIQAKENTCMVQVTKKDKGKALSCNFAYGGKAESRNFLGSIKDCLELFLKEEVIVRHCEKCFKVHQQASTTGSTHGNTSVDSILIEQQYEHKHAVQKVTISKLPPVLTVQLMRFDNDKNDRRKQVKIKGHVSFEETLDVRQYMDPSSEDKDHSSYRLVGVIEHIGDSWNIGHVIAYVRGSRDGNNKQLSSGSSSWFCADDDHIRQVSLEEVLKCEAFVLFYERMES